ncbi:MAG: DnaJ domain-containing protein, partial [Thiovulaceae bacterium]|nr:DnaJ domain-containing protein [Sulfurimonadaceae bacterium]
LNLSEQEYELILSKFENMMRGTKQSMSLDQAYEILGVKESDDMNTVKKSYRKLVREYHPDIMKSKDKGEEYIEQATAKTQEINQAYQSIKEARK